MKRSGGLGGGPQKPLIILIPLDPPHSRLAPVHMHQKMERETHTHLLLPQHMLICPTLRHPVATSKSFTDWAKRTGRTGRGGGKVTIPFKHDSLDFILNFQPVHPLRRPRSRHHNDLFHLGKMHVFLRICFSVSIRRVCSVVMEMTRLLYHNVSVELQLQNNRCLHIGG